MDLVAIGSSAFLPGFALAGVETVMAHNSSETLSIARSAKPGSILIIDEPLVRDAAPQDRAWLETSADPIIITIGVDDAQSDRLRRAIRDTLGIDPLAKS